MSQQNGGTPDGQRPWEQESTSATPHVFPFGTPAQGEQDAPQVQTPPQGSQPQQWGQHAPQQGSQPQQWSEPQQWGQQGSQPQQWAPQQEQHGSQQQWGGAPQQYGQDQYGQPQYGQDPYAQQPPAPQYGDPAAAAPHPGAQQSDPWAQPSFGSGPQHPQQAQGQDPYGQQPGAQPVGSQGQTAGGPPQQWNDPAQAPVGQEQGSAGNPQFSGILDPHTGEIHPVPDLQNLDDTDALLVVVSGPDAGAQILLDTDVVTVGRSPNADIFLDDVTVSRKHAEFVRTPSGFTLRDTGSLNGTYVGRQLIDSIELQNGADVQIGKFRMIFQQRPRTS